VNLYTFLIFKFKWILGVGRFHMMSLGVFASENGLFGAVGSLTKKVKMPLTESNDVPVRVQPVEA
jgi:hypothetical protein